MKEKKKLVEVDVFSMFGSEPVKRKERPKVEKKPAPVTNGVVFIDDDDVDEAEMSIINDQIKQLEAADAAVKSAKPEVKSPSKSSHKSPHASPAKTETKVSPKKESEDSQKSTAGSSGLKRPKSKSPSPTPKKAKITKAVSSKKKEKPVKEFTVEDDEARHERKQAAVAMYHKFANRVPVLNHGCKEIPKGKPNCLKGFKFVISGVLEAMEREEAADLIKSCGGEVVGSLSKKVTHMVVGEEAGMAKLAKAESMNIPQISEDDLLSMIRKKSGLPEPAKKVEETAEVIKDSPGKENRESNKETDGKMEVQSPSTSADKKKSEKAGDSSVKSSPKSQVSAKSSSQLSQQPSSSSQASQPASQAAAPQVKNMDHCSFVDKYKPTSVKSIIGQQGPSGNAAKLMNWLSKWHANNDGKTKHAKPNPWAKDNDGRAYKAALLSGSPGVGKTTTAHLVSQELMFDIVEFNASDTRSKKLLKEEVSSLLSNTSLAGYLSGSDTKASKRHVLIMDEVDGMAGNEDRGGVAELIGLIKESKVPIICMCNDRNHPKIRSLANYCFDLRFHKPALAQVRSAMMSVCFKEGIKLEAGAIDEIIAGTGNDIRQTLNHLALYSASKDTKLSTADAKTNAQINEKDVKIVSIFENAIELVITVNISLIGSIRNHS